ncbi:autotransporter-associated beta strand repeat-containing protein [Paraburkholderia fungorum]|uniref:Autotransporter-associated beta strand repeat-containing protein n=1 Tax=Paraburkholderia fungorum TaxID=134537 RepID=A0A1H1JJH1_9BURK|nr:phosphatase PAP2 family protein [Paraburkholderia fungorum]SDR49785.1 autotransporter-associated beta strand repeat-containing protein [Paraburkholderia fungorum]
MVFQLNGKSIQVAALASLAFLSACGGSSNSLTPTATSSAAVPAAPADPTTVDSAPVNTSIPAYVDTYYTNLADNSCYDAVSTNASIRALKGLLDLWTPVTSFVDADTYGGTGLTASTDPTTGAACASVPASTWDGMASSGGTILNSGIIGTNTQYVETVAASRDNSVNSTANTAKDSDGEVAYKVDVGSKDYNLGEAAGVLATSWRTGLDATQTITYVNATSGSSATVSEGDASGQLSNLYTMAGSSGVGNFATGNTSKYYFKYARPYLWSSEGISIVVPALQSAQTTTAGLSAAKNAGFASGHTAEYVRRAAAMAYALPERFQEFYAAALKFGEYRIIAGVHSPLDVIGGRMVGLAAAAANLYSAENSALSSTNVNSILTTSFKTTTRSQALSAMQSAAGKTTWKDFYDYLHSGTQSTDSTASGFDLYYDHDKNKTDFERRMTIGMSAYSSLYPTTTDPVVPKGAEVLLETRYPYLSADQRRVMLKTTEFASGYPVMTDAEGWGRLDMFKAGDGYGAFNGLVTIAMNSSLGGFATYDIWRNDISGAGKLTFKGDGTLKLAGTNTYSGGTEVEGGTLAAGSAKAFGTGDVYLGAGGITIAASATPVKVPGKFTVLTDGTLELDIDGQSGGQLTVGDQLTIAGGTLHVKFVNGYTPKAGDTITLINGAAASAKFTSVVVDGGLNGTLTYSSSGVSIKLSA